MTWSIEEVDNVVLACRRGRVEHGCGLSSDGDASFSFDFERIEYLLVLGIFLLSISTCLEVPVG